MDIREKTYESLRSELIQWQNRRYIIFSSTIVFVTAFLGWIVTSENEWKFYVASILPLLLIIGAALLTRNSTVYSVKIGTYFQVFYNDDWEMNQGTFSKNAKIISTNCYFAGFYLFVSILSVIVLSTETKIEKDLWLQIVFYLVCLIDLVTIGMVFFNSYPRDKYLRIWEELKARR